MNKIFGLALLFLAPLSSFGRGGELGNARSFESDQLGLSFHYPKTWTVTDRGRSVFTHGTSVSPAERSSASIQVLLKDEIVDTEALKRWVLSQSREGLVSADIDGRPGFEVRDNDSVTRTLVLIEPGRVAELQLKQGTETDARIGLETVRETLSFDAP